MARWRAGRGPAARAPPPTRRPIRAPARRRRAGRDRGPRIAPADPPTECRAGSCSDAGTALALTLVPVAAAALSGVAAAVRRPGERVTSGLQHFAAGVVFAAAAIELLPPVLQQAPTVAVIG